MTTNIAVLHFPDRATAYQALSDLNNTPLSNDIKAAAIVERDLDGKLSIPDSSDAGAWGGFATGGLIGMFVGLLGGPLGMLLGWSLGAATGSVVDASKGADQTSALLSFAQQLPKGNNVLMLQIEETDPSFLDQFAAKLGGTVTRRPYDQVLDEVEAQQDAALAAQSAADDKLRQQKKAERKEDREERLAKLKAKFD